MRNRKRGVSIAETLVAIFLLALLISVVFNLFPTTVLANQQGSERLQAMNVAQTVLSEVRTRPFDLLVVGTSEIFPATTADGVKYTSQVKVMPPDSGDDERLRVLEINVSWKTRNIERSLVERLWVHRRIEEKV